MKRSLCTLISLFALLAGGTARADLVVPSEPFRQGFGLSLLPFLIVALLIVTALLVRHFTRKGKK